MNSKSDVEVGMIVAPVGIWFGAGSGVMTLILHRRFMVPENSIGVGQLLEYSKP